MLSARMLRQTVEECRTIAENMRHHRTKTIYLNCAFAYDLMAEILEKDSDEQRTNNKTNSEN